MKHLKTILTDIGIYVLLISLPLLSFRILGAFLSRIPFQMIAGTQQTVEGLEGYLGMLMNVVYSFIGSLLILFLLVVIVLGVGKTLVWLWTLHQKMTWKILFKGVGLASILTLIFILPYLWAFAPFAAIAKTGLLIPKPQDYTRLIIVSIVMTYVMTLAFAYLAKTQQFKKAFVNSFKLGTKNFLRNSPIIITAVIIIGVAFILLTRIALSFFVETAVMILILTLVSHFARSMLTKHL